MKEPWFTICYLSALVLTAIAISAFRNRDKRHLFRYIITGHLLVNVPAILLILGIPAAIFMSNDNTISRYIFTSLGFIGGLGLAWITWSLLIPKWRIWAFRRVSHDDLTLLKKMAIRNRLIWEDGNPLEKSDIRLAGDREIISEINDHIHFLEGIEELQQDLTTASGTLYKANRRDLKMELICKVMIAIIAIVMVIQSQEIPGLLLLAVLAITGRNPFLIRKYWMDYLLITDRGIRIEGQFYNWGEMNQVNLVGDYLGIRIKLRDSEKPLILKFHDYHLKDHREFISLLRLYISRYIEMRESLSRELN